MSSQKHKGFFITFEGPDGGGKTTHSVLLKEYLAKKGFPVLHTREPGGTSISEALRRLLLHPSSRLSALTELLLYEAARAQHLEETIRPALAEGKIVICERFTDATVAYQGYGRKLSLPMIKTLNTIATQGLVPDLTICLDISPQSGLKKAVSKNHFSSQGDRLEQEPASFHARVRQGYLKLHKENPKRIKLIPTAKTINETHRKVIQAVEAALSTVTSDK